MDEEIDRSVMVGAWRIAKLREISIRGALELHRTQALSNFSDSRGTGMESYWSRRVDRIDAILQEPDDQVLRRRGADALAREDR